MNMKTNYHVSEQKKGASLVLILVIVVLLVFLFTVLYIFFSPSSGRLGRIKDSSDDLIGDKIDMIEDNVGTGNARSNQTSAPPALRDTYDAFVASLDTYQNTSDCYTTIPLFSSEQFGVSGSDTTYTTVLFDPLVNGEGTLVSLSRGYGGMDYTRDTIGLNVDVIDTQAELDSLRQRIYGQAEVTLSYDAQRVLFSDSHTLMVSSSEGEEEEEYDIVTIDDQYLVYVTDTTLYFIRNCAGWVDGCRGSNSHYRELVQGGENIALQNCE
jgi:hypothetical protein